MVSSPYRLDSPSSYIGRLAPSPTGALHLGNARSFLIAWLHCRQHQGQLILRIEDLHLERIKEGATEQIFEDLKWLGLHWDLGPKSILDVTEQHEPSYVQSQQKLHYENVLADLIERELVYPCYCTRQEILDLQSAPHGDHEIKYPNSCRPSLSLGQPLDDTDLPLRSYRFKAPDISTTFQDGCHGEQVSNVSQWSGDFVVAKNLQNIGYQLAVVLDDIQHNITHVIRGDDLLKSTHRQLHLYQALGATPPQFIHLPLLIGHDGKRLAKRHGDWKISTLRNKGWSPEAVLGLLAWTMGMQTNRDAVNLFDMLQSFSLQHLPIAPFILNEDNAKTYGVL